MEDCTFPHSDGIMRDEEPESVRRRPGAWQCEAGHMFRYEAPPASPPWCKEVGCETGSFRWVQKDEVTSEDWIWE